MLYEKLKDLKISHNQTRFAAQIDGFKTTKRLFGKVEWYIDVPVLNRMLRPGEEIQADDIILQKIESHKINAFHLTDAGQLIGMIGRHSVLKPGVLLTKSDVQAPMVVKRGAVMRVTLKKGSLTVSNKWPNSSLSSAVASDSLGIGCLGITRMWVGA